MDLLRPTSPATFITYSLHGIKKSPMWVVPNYEQVLCSCLWGSRAIAVGTSLRCDNIQSGNLLIQHGPSVTFLILDCGQEFCSYAFTRLGMARPPLTTSPESVFMVPFSKWSGVGRDRCIQSFSGGIMTLMWDLNESLHITITIYRPEIVIPIEPNMDHEKETQDKESNIQPNEQSVSDACDFLETILKESNIHIQENVYGLSMSENIVPITCIDLENLNI
ncbi:nuclear protein UL4 [Canid alphaherpesvirus 1]|uniref:Nuclear protein UL4 n=2 Tax=Canid alphaherpesvirus 1 TaxID=170325 RepID=A0A172DSU9_9ALPH|nr:nuclear protein UL4 [Canid alphaherpesvirus 1]ALL25931.1 nuclear protein UL4 [Canid alphaherpesvirus 1]ALL26012.1 nuclear protein UL4 [Canid alphaherpesvirus 1]ALL26087.1 nuclear protein UL4 [Canid alphaherpesvirus 1]ARE29859.1 nuclear protein UL4 [Canid alphaherpesvirus 1]QQL08545.1 nuclear protein UL4 [Canid alphaherpesvirus 1]